ncbi:MAG: putative phage tail protein [Bariatricus sp.]
MTEEELVDNFPISESAKRMLSYVTSGFYEKSYVAKWLYQVMGMEYDDAVKIVEEIPYQFFPETATWGLGWHEEKWGLPVRDDTNYEERRRLIYQKRDYRAPMTPHKMERYLYDVIGMQVNVSDYHDTGPYNWKADNPNAFKVFFTGDESLDTEKARKLIDKLKQSHTTYEMLDVRRIVINERIEHAALKVIAFKTGINFWRIGSFLCYNGETSYTGKQTFRSGKNKRYKLDIILKNEAQVRTKEKTELVRAEYETRVNTGTVIDAAQRFRVEQKTEEKNGTYIRMSAAQYIKEQIGELEVITQTPDCNFFDGKTTFSGNTKYNNKYRKEVEA